MSVFTSTGGQSSAIVVLPGVTNPQIDAVILATGGTEYAVALPANTKRYFLKLRDIGSDLKLRYVSGMDYVTIPVGCNYSEDDITVASLTIYLEAVSNTQTVEIVTWS